ncbi:ABC transporter permease [Actinokineospora iranica]|uniref:Putative ABC transport system permease protein n=1 Tax=Actinokineospora iranica TaxID=1271860 RepID=A0A1G6TAY3_9PSEU|nr:ABC transporter permease [Actinokineospora iranica]SDD26014.1 putative ABC transport system permease protein [Actinokineospora iranica]
MGRAELGLDRPRLTVADLLREAWLSLAGHPARSLLTALGTVLGAAAFVATLGLSSTLAHQVADSFDVRRATEVTARGARADAPSWQEPSALARLGRLNGVRVCGARVILPERPVSRSLGEGATPLQTQVSGVDAGALAVISPRVVLGRAFDSYHDTDAQPVVMLPAAVARGLGVHRVGVAVFIEDRPYTVIGIFDDVARRPEALVSVLVPYAVAQPMAALSSGEVKRDVVIETEPGAAQLVGAQAALALAPEDPARVEVVVPPDPRTLRQEIEGSVARLALVLSLVALGIGTVSIGNAATAGIVARTAEIGLRRAVGARPRHIFSQLIAETTLLGTLGGFLGAVGGIVITVVVALANGWQPVVDVTTALSATAAGAGAGLLAGLLPAWRATRIQPVVAIAR